MISILPLPCRRKWGCAAQGPAAYQLNPDYAIVVETTTAADIAGVQPHKRVCALGKGAVVSFMDRSTLYDRKLYDFAFSLAEREKISAAKAKRWWRVGTTRVRSIRAAAE